MIINLYDWFRKKEEKIDVEDLKYLPEKIHNEKRIIESLLSTLQELDEKISEHINKENNSEEEQK